MLIEEKMSLYIENQKKLTQMRKQVTTLKQTTDHLEGEIKEYMTKNDLDSINIQGSEIVMYNKKTSRTFSKENIIENLKMGLNGDEPRAERLAESILKNKIFSVEPKVKAVIKK
jgi:predicted RNase H-like nuclease (RuvC/YqgF family)